MEGLQRQSVPLSSVQVILVGSARQAGQWEREFGAEESFQSIQTIPAADAHYYKLKNLGAKAAVGEIIVLADTDVVPEPEWLAAIKESIDSGAELSAGVSRFYRDSTTPWPAWMLDIAASISWGFIVGETNGRWVQPRGFLSHNAAFRRDTLVHQLYPEEFGRTCAGSILYGRLVDGGVRIVLNPRQRIAHAFSMRWWIGKLHARFGYEVYRLRRMGSQVVNSQASHLGLLEPVLTMAWHILLDVPQWFRYSRLLGWSLPARLLAVPVLLALSALARGSEMIAMYRTIASPKAMEQFALRS